MKKIKSILLLLAVSFVFLSCNESSAISIMQALASSQPKDGKRWKSAEVIYNSSDPYKVDAVVILANDGAYVVNASRESGGEYLTNPTFKNNMKDGETQVINGLIRNVYIPSNYDSDSFPYIIIQCTSSKLYEPGKYYKVDLRDLTSSGVSELTMGDGVGAFRSRSSSGFSEYIMLCDKKDTGYTYKVGKYRIDGAVLNFDANFSFDSDIEISNFFESEHLKYLILTSTSGDDVKEQKYYKYEVSSSQFEELNKLYSLAIRHFFIYDDGVFLGFTQSGSVVHSSSSNSYLYTSDSSFSYNRYTPLGCFRAAVKQKDDEPDLTFFGKYSGNGFIIQGYNKTLSDSNKTYNSSYPGSVQTQGYAESLRAEDISEIKAVKLSSSQDGYDYRVLVMSSENGISTYLFKSCVPNQMTYTSPCKESRNRVDLFV